MMRVVYVCNSDLGKPDTVGVRTFHAAREAEKRGYLSSILTRRNKQDELKKVVVVPFAWLGRGLSFIRQYVWKNFDATSYNTTLFETVASHFLEHADIVHFYDYLPKLMKKAKENGSIVILDAHAGYVKEAVEILEEDNKRYGFKQGNPQSEIDAVETADYIICASDFNKTAFIKHGVPRERLKTIYFGVDMEHFRPIERKLVRRPIFLFVGIIEPRKGVEYLLKAFEGMKADLYMAGRQNKMMAGKLKVPPNVTLLGQVSPIRDYYDKADVFILPSLWESSAKTTYEALSCGLPVIVTPNAGPFFKDRTCGHIVPAKDVDALKYSIQHFIEHPQHIIDMGKAGRQMVKNYTWKKYGERVNDFYEEVSK